VVAYDFPPHAAIGTMRTLRLVRHLARAGWKVSVLTGDPRTYLPSTPVDEALLARVPESVEVIRASSMRKAQVVSGSKKGAAPVAQAEEAPARKRRWPAALVRAKAYVDAATAIPDREAAWWLPAVRAGLRHARQHRPDVIFSSAPPWTGQLVAAAIASRVKSPWVADFRDPWARLPWRENRPWTTRTAAQWFEDQTVRRAAAVVFTTQGILDQVAAHHDPALASKYHVVPNGCEVAEFEELERGRGSLDPPKGPAHDQFVLLHAGSLYGGRDPQPLLRAIAAAVRSGAIDPARFRLRLIGTLALDGVNLTKTCDELGLRDVVQLVPRIPRRDSLAEMTAASALLLVQPGHPLSIPAKAYEYLATGRPVLAIADEGETANLIRSSGAGLVVSGDDEAGMAEALGQLVRATANVRRADPVWFDGEQRAAEVAELFEALLTDRASVRRTNDAGAVEIVRGA
jgi:glycosyltransferase involved in cell wall biosynthesis